MLASDLDNPAFVNPSNPDSALYVEFYWHQPLDMYESAAQKREIRLERRPYVRIMRPGDTLSVIETPVRDDHKERWPQKWLDWQMREGLIEGATADVPGWKLKEWGQLNEEQLRELTFLRFVTVEQLAGAADAQIQRLGMGGLGLREKARQAIKEQQQAAILEATAERDRELATLRERDSAREREIAELKALVNAPRRRGRPPKVEAA